MIDLLIYFTGFIQVLLGGLEITIRQNCAAQNAKRLCQEAPITYLAK